MKQIRFFFLFPPLRGPGDLHKALAFATSQALQRLIDSAVAGERAEEAVIDQAEYINDTVNELYTGNETIRASNAEGFFLERADGVIRRWYEVGPRRLAGSHQ